MISFFTKRSRRGLALASSLGQPTTPLAIGKPADEQGFIPLLDGKDLDNWKTPGKNPDGTKNKFPVALKDFAHQGHIGLQDHGRPVWYRSIRIKRLDP